MTERHSTSVIVRAAITKNDGTERVLNYGPFLPHAGSATNHFVSKLKHELEDSDWCRDFDISVETVFLGDGESDCVVLAADRL